MRLGDTLCDLLLRVTDQLATDDSDGVGGGVSVDVSLSVDDTVLELANEKLRALTLVVALCVSEADH